MIFFINKKTFADEVFAPITNETWECETSDRIETNLTIDVDNINETSSGIFNNVEVNNTSDNIHILSGMHRGVDPKFYTVVLQPAQDVNFFRGKNDTSIEGKAFVHLHESSECLGELKAQVIYQCKVNIQR